jgi:hypothetical protein
LPIAALVVVVVNPTSGTARRVAAKTFETIRLNMNYLLFPDIAQLNLPKESLGYELGAGSQFMV